MDNRERLAITILKAKLATALELLRAEKVAHLLTRAELIAAWRRIEVLEARQ